MKTEDILQIALIAGGVYVLYHIYQSMQKPSPPAITPPSNPNTDMGGVDFGNSSSQGW